MLQNIFSGWIADGIAALVLALGGGAMIAWIKARRAQWIPPLTTGLVGSVLIFALALMFIGWRSIPPYVEPTTNENVDVRVREWALSFGYGVQPQVSLGEGTPD